MISVRLAAVSLLLSVLCSVCKAQNKLSVDETVALTRDHLARDNPDALLQGFIPVWAIIIYLIAGTFLVVAVLSGLLYLLGCRTPERYKRQFVALADHN